MNSNKRVIALLSDQRPDTSANNLLLSTCLSNIMNASSMTHLDSALQHNIGPEQKMFEQGNQQTVIERSCKRVTDIYHSTPVCSLVMLTSAFTHLTYDMANRVMEIVVNIIMKRASHNSGGFYIGSCPGLNCLLSIAP